MIIFTATAAGTSILKLKCLVLCLKIYIPHKTPIPPSKNAHKNNVFSLMRCLFFTALYLSMPIKAHAIKFHTIRTAAAVLLFT